MRQKLPRGKAEASDPALHMEMETLRAEREDRLNAEEIQANRERCIAEAHEVAGRIQALKFVRKVVSVSTLVQLKRIKESKAYKDIPNIGTWDKYCNYLGFSHQNIDKALLNLSALGEKFLLTCEQFSVGYRQLRQLRQLTHDGSVIIDGDCLTIENESIPIDQDHAEELQAAIERIITDRQEINKRLTKLEKDFTGAVNEEVKGLKTEKKALLERVHDLEKYEPKAIDETRFEEQYQEINELTATLAVKISALMRMETLSENPVLMARVEGYVESATGLVDRLRDEWSEQLQFENK
jgi:hypothetical protein